MLGKKSGLVRGLLCVATAIVGIITFDKMPPKMARSLTISTWQCPSCLYKRMLSTSGSAASRIRPESPRYIDVPEPRQQSIPDKPRVKGILPVPRNIFGGRGRGRGLDRASPENIARRIPLSSKESTKAPSEDPSIAWKQRMADMRRKNLKEGLEVLRDRKIAHQQTSARRARRNQIERETLLSRPELEDERLTNPSVDAAFQKYMEERLPDPHRELRLQEKRDRVEMKESTRKDARQDALHTLYMQARTFITTDAQLDEAITEAFGIPGEPKAFESFKASKWAEGPPMTIQDMLNRANRTGPSAAYDTTPNYDELTKKRVKRIAEALTGGRMD